MLSLAELETKLKLLCCGALVRVDEVEYLKTVIGRIPYYINTQTGDAITGPQIIERLHRRRVDSAEMTVIREAPGTPLAAMETPK